MSLNNKFADNNVDVMFQQLLTADNNQTAINQAIVDTFGANGSSVIYSADGINATVVSPVPINEEAGTETIGAALGGMSQGTPGNFQTETGGDGEYRCFTGETLVLMSDWSSKPIKDVVPGDLVKSFDNLSNVINARVVGKWIHETDSYLEVLFSDGHKTNVTPEHRYCVGKDKFVPIGQIGDGVINRFDDRIWIGSGVREGKTIKLEKPILVYNLEIDIYRTYFANGDAVHNIKEIQF